MTILTTLTRTNFCARPDPEERFGPNLMSYCFHCNAIFRTTTIKYLHVFH